MPRTPAVFRRKRRWRKYEDSEFSSAVPNYRSAQNIVPIITAQFELEVGMGMMEKTTIQDAQQRYPGDRLRLAAQGALEKSDSSWRIIHDWSHGVNVNCSLKPRDLTAMPSASDLKEILTLCQEEKPGVHFSLQMDVKMAHRRYLHQKED